MNRWAVLIRSKAITTYLTLPAEEQKPVDVWGHRHERYLKQNHKTIYVNLQTSGKLNSSLSDIDEQAEDMFSQLVKQMAEFCLPKMKEKETTERAYCPYHQLNLGE